MRFATIKVNGTEKAGIVLKNGVLPIEALNAAKGTAWAEDVMSLIQKQQIPGLTNGITQAARKSWRAFRDWFRVRSCIWTALPQSETYLWYRS